MRQDVEPTLSYRDAVAGDREWLFRLKAAAMRDYVAAVYGWDEAEQRRRFDAGFDPGRIAIIRAAGSDVGMIEVAEEEGRFFLARIEILPAFQNRGIGTRAILGVLEKAAQKGKPVFLQVLRPNPAKALYERLGFSVYEETPTHFRMRRPS